MELIVLATRNEGKARELASALADAAERIESLTRHPRVALPPEGDDSYRENALGKARAAWHALRGIRAATVGDDSGLEVEALGGQPGVLSARFAGPGADDAANNARLLAELRGLPPEKRGARFRCVLALIDAEGRETIVEGVCTGRILERARGTRGFGYDPLFLPDGETRTFAELPPEAKRRISHRGRAAAVLSQAVVACS